jgi:o-succinylbenzoate synthase
MNQKLTITYSHYVLNFTFDAGTSRGVMKTRGVWYIKILDSQTNSLGIGEVAPIWGLSTEHEADVINSLDFFSQSTFEDLAQLKLYIYSNYLHIPCSVLFGLEIAIHDALLGGKRQIFNNNPFYENEKKIFINGLVWMGNYQQMLEAACSKIEQGFNCIKIKVGAIALHEELKLVENIRKRYSSDFVTLRLDANGAWSPKDAIINLHEFSKFHIHSIEQPIKAGALAEMQQLIQLSPIPIVLDEELIGYRTYESKRALLQKLQPAFIILKPSLLGGFKACDEWIDLADQHKVAWWITSALESNIGLNAICQYTNRYDWNQLPQGLGTGKLYHNNIGSPLETQNGYIHYNQKLSWNIEKSWL